MRKLVLFSIITILASCQDPIIETIVVEKPVQSEETETRFEWLKGRWVLDQIRYVEQLPLSYNETFVSISDYPSLCDFMEAKTFIGEIVEKFTVRVDDQIEVQKLLPCDNSSVVNGYWILEKKFEGSYKLYDIVEGVSIQYELTFNGNGFILKSTPLSLSQEGYHTSQIILTYKKS